MGERRTYAPGERATVVLERPAVAPRRLLPLPPPRLPERPAVEHQVAPVRILPRDLGTSYRESGTAVPSGIRSAYDDISHEMALTAGQRERTRLRLSLLNGIEDQRQSQSGRMLPARYPLQAGRDETDGALTGLELVTPDGAARKHEELIAVSLAWSPEVPRETRIAQLAAARDAAENPSAERLAYQRALSAAERERWEVWTAQSRARVNQAGELRFWTHAGQYRPACTSVYHYQPWDATDAAEYKWTETAQPYAPVVQAPRCISGVGQSTRLTAHLVPQLHEFQVRWVAEYLFISLFNYSVLYFVNVGRFWDRLPNFPYAYRLTEPGTRINDFIISRRLDLTLTVQRMKASDLAIQRFSLYFAIILVRRIAGYWEIRQRELFVDSLVAVIDENHGGGTARRVYGWRKTQRERDYTRLDFGSYHGNGVIGDWENWSFHFPV